VNQGCGPIYLFKLKCDDRPTVLQKIKSIIESDEEVLTNGKHTPSFTHAREQAKGYFDSKKFPEAIEIYSRALSLSPGNYDRSILLANRGMGYLCRRWEGDSYACVRDCVEALLLYPGNSKALWRLTRSLMLLEQWELAQECIEVFKKRFPNDRSIVRLSDQKGFVDRQIRTPILKKPTSLDRGIMAGSDCGSLLLWERSSGVLVAAWNADQSILNIVQPHPTQFMLATSGIEEVIRFWQPMEEGKEKGFVDRQIRTPILKKPTSLDRGIIAGSDCGSLLLWERSSGVLVAAWNADQSILNIVQPHPTQFMLATSGIEEVIRFWQPMEEGKECERRIAEPWSHFGQRNRRSADERDIFLRFIGSRMMGRSPERPECVTS
ncbi:tetratricopeptide repeat protein, partial [Ostertagia ostertagi]